MRHHSVHLSFGGPLACSIFIFCALGFVQLPAKAESAPADVQAGFSLPPLEALTAVTERPLFSSSRRRPPPPPQVMAATGPVILAGIVLSRGQRHAIVRDETSPSGRRVTEGHALGGGILKRIHASHIVIVDAGGRETVVKLFGKPEAHAGLAGHRDSLHP